MNSAQVQITSLKELYGYQYLTHMETLTITHGDRKLDLTYCHKQPSKRGSLPEPYGKFLASFLNTNSRFVRPGSTVIDIGAYDGDTTLPLAWLAGTGKVFAFECSPSFVSQLQINLGFNPSLPVEAFPYAIMPEAGVKTFLYCATDDNGGDPSTNQWVGTYTVPTFIRAVSFESFMSSRCSFSDISFIKIDTEGADFPILLSFKKLLKEIRPVIHAEWVPRTDPYISELISYLDYRVYCGFTLEPIVMGGSPWRQDIILVPSEQVAKFSLV